MRGPRRNRQTERWRASCNPRRLTATRLAASADTTSPDPGVKAGRPDFRSVSDARDGIVHPCPIIVPRARRRTRGNRRAAGVSRLMDFISRLTPAARLHPLRSGPAPPSGGPGRAACWLPRALRPRCPPTAGPSAAAAGSGGRAPGTLGAAVPCPRPSLAPGRGRPGPPQFAAHLVEAHKASSKRHPQHRPQCAPCGPPPVATAVAPWPRRRRGGPRPCAQSRNPSSDRIRTCRRASSSPALACPRRSVPRPSDEHDLTKVGVARHRRSVRPSRAGDPRPRSSATAEPTAPPRRPGRSAGAIPWRSSARNSDTPGRPSPVLA